jgi:hypothetical protein
MSSLRLALLLSLVLPALLPASALAQVTATRTIEEAVDALRANTVHVDPEAESALSDTEADQLRARIAEAGGRIYIAVLPAAAAEETGGDPDAVGPRLARDVDRPGVYGVVVGRRFRAGNQGESTRAAELAAEAIEAKGREGAAAVLTDFVTRVGRARRGEDTGGSRGTLDGSWLLALLAGGAALLGLSRLRRGRARRARQAAEWDEVRDTARDDLVALGEDIRALDLDVDMPDADPAAKEDYGRAVTHYERASELFDRAKRPEDLEGMTQALEEGRYAMAAAKARLDGREPPERRSPCFFDPRHGPSARDVEWSPPGGAPRLVPACEADAQRVERGDDPETREVTVGGRRVPYYDAGPAYGPWAGGYFGGVGGGLLPGLLIGSMLGGGMGFGYPDSAEAAGDWGGGDLGGDWGGGDLGGGGWGGGDFGGGGE